MKRILLMGLFATMIATTPQIMAQTVSSETQKITNADLVTLVDAKEIHVFCYHYKMKCDVEGVRKTLSVIAEADRQLFDETWANEECPAKDPKRWVECYEGTPKQKVIFMENVLGNSKYFEDGVLTVEEAKKMVLSKYD